jgi:rhodanese-related sulfurtransferase
MHRDHPAYDYTSVVDASTQFIDVREPGEVAEGTLPGAINIPLGELPGRLHELDPTRRVVLLCRSGARSARAAEMLTADGFGDVVNLTGGVLVAAGR